MRVYTIKNKSGQWEARKGRKVHQSTVANGWLVWLVEFDDHTRGWFYPHEINGGYCP